MALLLSSIVIVVIMIITAWFWKISVHTHPTEGHWKLQGGEGCLKKEFPEECMGVKTIKINPSVWGVYIFSGATL